jgi:excisionase family DNA binding protein
MSYNDESDFLTVEEVTQLLKLSSVTIYKYIRQNRLEAVAFGGRYRIAKASLERFIEKHRVRSST